MSNEKVISHDPGGGRGRSLGRLRRGTPCVPDTTAGANQTDIVAQHVCGLMQALSSMGLMKIKAKYPIG